jgi:tetratricopeptide (TPR) repeat protein
VAINRRALDIASRTLGDAHQTVGFCSSNLATVLWKMGRDDEAAALFERAIASWRQSIGAEHPNIAGALHSLAMIRNGKGDAAAAIELLRSAIAIREEHFGADHDLTRKTRELLETIEKE